MSNVLILKTKHSDSVRNALLLNKIRRREAR